MKILVTGATGFAGSWMCRKLLDEGHNVVILRRENSDLSEIEHLELEHAMGDVTDKGTVIRAMKDVQHVFHLAGVVGYSKAQRGLMEKVNVQGTQNVVEACVETGVEKLLHFSSVVSIGAGRTEKEILNEGSKFNLGHLNLGYFETKKQAEEIVFKAVKEQKLHAVAVNPSTIYGPGDAKKGSRKTQVKVAQGRFPFYTAGGVSIISIEDVVKAAFTAWQSGSPGERYILSGDNITIKELFHIISDCAGVAPPKFYLPKPIIKALGITGDMLEAFNKKGMLNSENAATSVMYHWFDNSKAKKHLGLNPQPARTAIESSIRWIKENGLLG